MLLAEPCVDRSSNLLSTNFTVNLCGYYTFWQLLTQSILLGF